MEFYWWKMRAYIEKVGKETCHSPMNVIKAKKKKIKKKRENYQAFESFVWRLSVCHAQIASIQHCCNLMIRFIRSYDFGHLSPAVVYHSMRSMFSMVFFNWLLLVHPSNDLPHKSIMMQWQPRMLHMQPFVKNSKWTL